MFSYFKEAMRNLGYRGWRLEDDDGVFYISKFDDRFNDDEYRFYLEIDENAWTISNSAKLKSDQKIVRVLSANPYLHTANEIVQQMNAMEFPYPRAI